MSARMAIAGCWLFVAALLAWLWFDTSWPWFLVAAAASAAVGAIGAASTSRWAGALLILAGLALGAAVLLAVLAIGGAAHGGRPAAVVFGYIGIFALPPIAIFSIILGLSRLVEDASDHKDAADSVSDMKEHE